MIDPLDELLMWSNQVVECRAGQRPDNQMAVFNLIGELDALEAIHRLRTKIIKGEL